MTRHYPHGVPPAVYSQQCNHRTNMYPTTGTAQVSS